MGEIGPIKREREYEPVEEPYSPAVPEHAPAGPVGPSLPESEPLPVRSVPEREHEPATA